MYNISLFCPTRFLCLRFGLRLQPAKACKVITVCLMLHNHARRLHVPVPDDPSDSSSSEDEGDSDGNRGDDMNERARTAAGKTVRDRIINECF